jgi:hypothetical protein
VVVSGVQGVPLELPPAAEEVVALRVSAQFAVEGASTVALQVDFVLFRQGRAAGFFSASAFGPPVPDTEVHRLVGLMASRAPASP